MLVGLTGQIGSGKSTVLKIFKELGAITVSADQLAHEALEQPAIKQAILSAAGNDLLDRDGAINREALAEVIFASEDKRKRVEEIIHPYVFRQIEKVAKRYSAMPDKIIVAEIPLLFESGYQDQVDLTITVTCPEEKIFERIAARGMTLSQFEARARCQLSQSDKAARADYCIDNCGSLEELREKVEKVWKSLLQQKRDDSSHQS